MRTHIRYVLLVALFAAATGAAAGNKAPSVSLTAPKSGATFTSPASITVSASASDSDGTIAKVDFYQGSALIGTRTAAPYTIAWNNVSGGAYSLTARATDNAGATKTSSAVAVTVTGPTLFIASPLNGDVVYGTTAIVTGTFSGETGSTIVVDNGHDSRIATITGYEYYAYVPVYVGTNALRVAVARRNRTSDVATVTVTGNLNPLLTFTAPAASVFDSPTNVTLAVDAVSPAGTISKVDFFRNGTLLGTVPAPPYGFAWSNVPAGAHLVSATATDDRGYVGTATLPITVNGPNAPPSVSLTAPAGGANFVAPASIALGASAGDSDGSVTKVEFLQNGTLIGVTNTPPYAMTWSNVPAGSYALTARATDNRAAVTTSVPVSITVVAPNAPPTVTLTAPVAGATFTAPATIALAASAADSDGTVSRVDFYQGTTLIGSKTGVPFTATWSSVGSGTYSLTAKATDNAGATAASAPVNVVVNANSPPTVSLTSPVSGSSYFAPATIALAANASDSDGTIAKVEFYQGATLIGASSGAPYAATWSNAPPGTYSVTAKATDNAGATATSAAVGIVVAARSLTIDAPAANTTVNGEVVNVSGSLQAPLNSGVTVNGVIAAVEGVRFYANNVALANGANTITAILTTPEGATTSQAITVTSTGPSPVQITVDASEGFAPLTANIAVAALPGIGIQKMEIDADGNGTFDQVLMAAPWATTVTYLSPGTVNLIVKVTDTTGNTHMRTFPLVMTDPLALDQMLRAAWNGMKTALAASDKAGAMRFLDASAQLRYGPAFDALLPNLGQIFGTFSDPQSVSLSEGLGEYAINRVIGGQNRIFFIYFGRNGDGVWRLGSM